eukprot:1326559-Rhodomonas_salina.1
MNPPEEHVLLRLHIKTSHSFQHLRQPPHSLLPDPVVVQVTTGLRLTLSENLCETPRSLSTNILVAQVQESQRVHSPSTPASLPAPSGPTWFALRSR